MLLDLLGTIVGFIAIILLLSLAVTSLVELLQAGLRMRQTILKRGIEEMFKAAGEAGFSMAALTRKHPGLIPQLNVQKSDLAALVEMYKGAANAALCAKLESFFALMEQRTSELFKARMWVLMFLSSLAVAFLMQASAPALLQRLWQEPAYRAVAVALAENLDRQAPPGDGEQSAAALELDVALQNVAKIKDELAVAELIPWHQGWAFYASWSNRLGVLITAFLLTLGAPFWFDLLRKLLGILKAAQGKT